MSWNLRQFASGPAVAIRRPTELYSSLTKLAHLVAMWRLIPTVSLFIKLRKVYGNFMFHRLMCGHLEVFPKKSQKLGTEHFASRFQRFLFSSEMIRIPPPHLDYVATGIGIVQKEKGSIPSERATCSAAHLQRKYIKVLGLGIASGPEILRPLSWTIW